MSNAFVCDICTKYYKDNNHTRVEGIIYDYENRSRTIYMDITKIKENNGYYYDEIEHICRDCLLKLLDSAYPEIRLNSLVDPD